MKTQTVLAFSTLFVLGNAGGAVAQDFQPPHYQFTAAGGRSMFRGGDPNSTTGSALTFQPDGRATTFAGILSVRATRGLRLDFEAALSRGRMERGFVTPDNYFFSAGLSAPLFRMSGGRLVPFLVVGGGITTRRARDSFQSTVEDAFGVKGSSPFGYGGGGIEYRATQTIGLRAGYRYSRIFPDSAGMGGVERKSYGAHRVLGGVTLAF